LDFRLVKKARSIGFFWFLCHSGSKVINSMEKVCFKAVARH
jgi:hypothetical protein